MNLGHKKKTQTSFLEETYRQYRNFMLGIAHRYLDQDAACEDAFHNAFLCLIRNEKRLQQLPPAKLQTYILLATKHACIDYLRKERKTNLLDLPDEVIGDLLAGARDSAAPFLSAELSMLMQDLSAEDQTLLIGHYMIGLNTGELADLIGCAPGNLRVKLHRARKRTFEKFAAAGLRLDDFIRD